ncbi:hypothetical protein [Phyllobacterium meliloti]|uniref:hypothetical protein n=1 Tax=Phyllobacterium meliloti TaxID=555317 RepID=UPI000DDC3ED2|nr:hypothetical protein [Phyllobacterium sp. T1293]UGX87077.1 hypothetical protein LLE53_004300 [Phyllobacterium sp. T1293]
MKLNTALIGLVLVSSGLLVSACQTADPSKVTMGSSTRSLTTKAGTQVLLTNILNYNPDCSTGRAPALKVISGPSHGTVQFAKVSGTLPKGPEGSPNKCHSRRISATSIRYTPAAGFSGVDKVTVSGQMAGQPQYFDYFSFTISVTK